MLKPSLIAKTDAKANMKQIHLGENYRVTVLSSKLIRFEFSKNGSFCDLPTQTVWYRNFEAPEFFVKESSKWIIIDTDDVQFTVSKATGKPLYIKFKSSLKTVKCNNKGNLKGTCRTLDGTVGRTFLNDGLVSKNGVYVLDDSKTMLIDENGMFTSRAEKLKDYYIFAYGTDYREAIKAFYDISSHAPMLPRYALGVWWSRYHMYTQQEYQNLMLKFKSEGIPLTVATVDMDWHWTDLNKQFSTNYKARIGTDNVVTGGWGGYSWNTDLFPDYKGFLKFLKNENLHITLNLHPADGIRFFENQYEEMANAVGVDPKTKQDIPFVCGSDTFWNAYFDILHKPYEREGVDFWWIDWQQGKESDVNGLDPLSALNHYHYLDNGEDGRIPMILSRYAGLGSHRYPLGFSGDTAMSWRVLDFQPYFTVNSANAAYTWWSHDIGGHHMGRRDDDLYIRWIQFGVFSPVLRLHSTSDDLLGKEPWKYSNNIHRLAKYYLCLRHSLIPYIYTMSYRTHREGIALCEPMYYSYSENINAYKIKNQYMFGSELMVCPITHPQIRKLNKGCVDVWFPKGRWTDIFTGESYCGDRFITLFRDIDSIPVFAKEGAVIPFAPVKDNSVSNPEIIDLWIYLGSNCFTLYEDSSDSDYEIRNCKTEIKVSFDKVAQKLCVTFFAVKGDVSVLPDKRQVRLIFKDLDADILACSSYKITVCDGCPAIVIDNYSYSEDICISLENARYKAVQDVKERVINVLSRWQEDNLKKKHVYAPFKKAYTADELRTALKNARLPKDIYLAVKEQLEIC